MKRIALAAIKCYQATRLLRAPACRFYPSCSDYLYQSIEMHGFFYGLLLGFFRLLKCHPLHPGGIDEVPCQRRFYRNCSDNLLQG